MREFQPNFFALVRKVAASLNVSLPPMRLTSDIMTRKIKVLSLDNTVSDFLDFMKKNNVRHVAIFDPPTEKESKPFFIGIVSERDVLRFTHPYADKTTSISKHGKKIANLLVQIVTRNPICVSPDTSITKLVSVMVKKHIDMVPVFKGDELVGIVTTTDIIKLLVTFGVAVEKLYQIAKTSHIKDSRSVDALAAWIGRTVGDVMTSPPLCLALKDTLERAIALLSKKSIRHILVTDKNKRLAGVVSDRDILRRLPYSNIRLHHKANLFREQLFDIPPDMPGLETPLAHVMEWELISVKEDCSIAVAAEKLYTERLSCLPVLDADENLTGIITVTDLMQVMRRTFR